MNQYNPVKFRRITYIHIELIDKLQAPLWMSCWMIIAQVGAFQNSAKCRHFSGWFQIILSSLLIIIQVKSLYYLLKIMIYKTMLNYGPKTHLYLDEKQ